MMKQKFLLLVLLSLCQGWLFAQTNWEVPADRNAKLSTEAFTEQSRNSGRDLYQTNCKSCHGDPGKNNAIRLVPAAAGSSCRTDATKYGRIASL